MPTPVMDLLVTSSSEEDEEEEEVPRPAPTRKSKRPTSEPSEEDEEEEEVPPPAPTRKTKRPTSEPPKSITKTKLKPRRNDIEEEDEEEGTSGFQLGCPHSNVRITMMTNIRTRHETDKLNCYEFFAPALGFCKLVSENWTYMCYTSHMMAFLMLFMIGEVVFDKTQVWSRK